MATSETLTNANVNHQIALTRFATGETKKLLPYLRDIIVYIEARLAREGETIESKKRLNKLLADTNKKLDTIYSKYDKKEFKPTLPDVSQMELDFQESSVNRVVINYESVVPSNEQAISAARNNPVMLGSKGGAIDFTKYTTDWKPQEIARVANRISAGFYAGETTKEISRAIVGLKSQNFADGILNISRANIQGMVRSSINHMSTQAKESFNQKNRDLIIGYRIIATLDSRTSEICRAYDQQVFLYKDGKHHPLPPFHSNCRTTTSPELSSEFDFLDKGATRASKGSEGGQQVSADLSYHQWLATQPAAFQDESLGKTKGLIFRNAGLTPDEFRKASVNQFNQGLTIEQMRQKDSDIDKYLASKE